MLTFSPCPPLPLPPLCVVQQIFFFRLCLLFFAPALSYLLSGCTTSGGGRFAGIWMRIGFDRYSTHGSPMMLSTGDEGKRLSRSLADYSAVLRALVSSPIILYIYVH